MRTHRLCNWVVLCTLLIGVLAPIAVLTPASVLADDYEVTAQVRASLPPETPQLLSPEDNSVQTGDMVTIVGTCPIVVPALIVVLVRSGETIGSGTCDPLGVFRIRVQLVLGVNVIYAKFMTITGETSGVGEPLTLLYTPVNNPSKPTATPGSRPGGLRIAFEYDLVTFKTNQPTTVSFTIKGGKGPYKVTINWGDGSSGTYTYDTDGEKTVSHTYKLVSREPVKIQIELSDADNIIAKEERAVVSFERPSTPAAQPSLAGGLRASVVLLWTAIAGVCLGIVWVLHHRRKHTHSEPSKPVAAKKRVAVAKKRVTKKKGNTKKAAK